MNSWNHPRTRSSFAPRFSFLHHRFEENGDFGAIMFPLISFYRSSSFNVRVALPRVHRTLFFSQRYSSAIRPPVPPYSPATGTKRRSQCVRLWSSNTASTFHFSHHDGPNVRCDGRLSASASTTNCSHSRTTRRDSPVSLSHETLFQLGRSHSESELYKLCSRVGAINNMTLYTANNKVNETALHSVRS